MGILWDCLYTLLKKILRPLFIVAFKIRTDGFDTIPKQGPFIVICNHMSAFDPQVVGALIPRPVYFMAKAELFRIRPFAYVIHALHAYPVKRGTPDRKALRYSLSLLRDGHTLLIFPEGHRTKTGELQPARSGTVFLSKHSNAPVIPVGIVGHYGFRRGIRYAVGSAFAIMHLKMSQVPFSKWRRWPKMIPEFLLHVEKHRGISLTELGSGPAT